LYIVIIVYSHCVCTAPLDISVTGALQMSTYYYYYYY